MLKAINVALGPQRYNSALECVVTFQVGDQRYNTLPVTLSPEQTRELVDLAIAHAHASFAVDVTGIEVVGEPVILPLIEEVADPEFAEVEPLAPAVPEELKPEEAF